MPTGAAGGDALVIEAQRLVKTCRAGGRALDGLTFGVEVGTVAALFGPERAGKSTAVRILTTLLRADAGRAWVAGADVMRAPDVVRSRIGCVPRSCGVDPGATGREDLLLAGRRLGVPGRTLERRAVELLDRFGLTADADRPLRGWPLGMRRRLDLARGLVHEPGVLFLDEPTAGLDPQSRSQLWAEVDRLCHEEGRTVLLATQDPAEVRRLASNVMIVDRGRVVVQGSPGQLIRARPAVSPAGPAAAAARS